MRDFIVVSGPPDQQMAAVAAAQRGRVNHRQLITVGMTPSMIYTRTRRGTLHALHRGVFAVGHPGRVELGDETAALLAYRDGTALAQHSACWVWRFLRQDPGEVHVILPRGAAARTRPGTRVHRSKTFSPHDVVIRQGLPVVKPALAIVQLAEASEDRELELALDEALATGAVSRSKLREAVATHGRGRRTRYLAELVEGGRPSSVTRSDAEERLRGLILSARLPMPETNVPLHGFEADFYWPDARYVVEFDGYAFHSSRSAWRRDRTKDRTYAAGGIRLDRFTWEDITDQALATIAHITRQLTTRAS